MKVAPTIFAAFALCEKILAWPSTASPRTSPTGPWSSRSPYENHAGFDIDTNYYDQVPDTGRTVTYYLEVNNGTVAPDGIDRPALLVNNSMPGPTIEAQWGDWIVVHVKNNLIDQGLGIHFHGIRQNQTNTMDGVTSITECPITPGHSFSYKWRATQYGTSWYHSHYALQQWDGVYGGIIVHGPSSERYDYDAGLIFLTDWGHQTVSSLFKNAEASVEPVLLETGLINGLNVYNDSGSRYETCVPSGKRYRYRVVNTAVNSMFRFTIDNHILTVIANDLVPVHPYNTTSINVGIGQRYDVVVSASQRSGDYWLRAIPQTRCSAIRSTDIRGILRYNQSSTELPVSTVYNLPANCNDDSESLAPYLPINVGVSSQDEDVYWTRNMTSDKLIRWTLQAKTSMEVEWSNPTLLQLANGMADWPDQSDVLTLTGRNEWVYIIIENKDLIIHPIHLHGHDFHVLASATNATYSPSDAANFTTINPPRRDTAILPAAGYLAVAFKTDNPGAWLLHCHIGWHLAEGMALQFIERQAEVVTMLGNASSLRKTCGIWSSYQSSISLNMTDSGL